MLCYVVLCCVVLCCVVLCCVCCIVLCCVNGGRKKKTVVMRALTILVGLVSETIIDFDIHLSSCRKSR